MSWVFEEIEEIKKSIKNLQQISGEERSILREMIQARILKLFEKLFNNFAYKNALVDPANKNSAIESMRSIFKDIFELKEELGALNQDFMKGFIKNVIETKNAMLLFFLKEYPEVYEKAMVDLSIKYKNFLNDLSSVENPYFLSDIMMRFGSEMGKINYQAGLLTAAQIHERKKYYNFFPVILRETQDSEFFSIILQADLPIREKFILTGDHWISGEISIDEGKNITIIFMDSLGTEKDGYYKEESPIYLSDSLINEFLQVLKSSQYTYNSCNIYRDSTKKQYSKKGCSVFAIDDVRHLYTVERYLPMESTLVEYLKEFTKNTTKLEGKIEIHNCSMPLFLMRTIQTSELLKEIIPEKNFKEREILKKIKEGNSKTLTIEKSAESGFIRNNNGKYVNERLMRQFERMCAGNLDYLLKTPMKKIENDMQQFTLKALTQRLALQKEKKFQQNTSTNNLVVTVYHTRSAHEILAGQSVIESDSTIEAEPPSVKPK